MRHRASIEDQQFRRAFEAQQVEPAAFDHEAHVRLAYVYLCEDSVEGAASRMKAALLAFLAKTLKIPRSAVRLAAGDTARIKRLELDGVDAQDLERAFGVRP